MAERKALYLSTDGKITEIASGDRPTGTVLGSGVVTVQVLTQAAYTALGTKDANTLYFIVG